MLRMRRAAYKLELYGHMDPILAVKKFDSNLVRFSRGMHSLGLFECLKVTDTPIGTLWTQGLKLSSVFEEMCSLGLVEVLDTPNSCFRIFSLKIFRSRTHVFIKYFAVLGLCCACGGPLNALINWNSMDTGTQLSSVCEGMHSLGLFGCWQVRFSRRCVH